MKCFLQACLGIVIIGLPAVAQKYRSPEVMVSKFGEDLGMLDREREKLAKNIVIYAGNRVAKEEREGHSLMIARRLIGLSLHLSPKNTAAVALDRRLSAGEIPPKRDREYQDVTLSEVLLEQSRTLRQGSQQDQLLADCLIEIAAMVSPQHKAAVRAMEIQKIQRGPVKWEQFTGD